ncbi:MAG: thioredoxin family protein [Planctomycetia bacterium]
MPLRRIRLTAISAMIACIAGAPLASATNTTGVPWHPTVEQAKAASVVSKRPVLLVFGAMWSEASVAVHAKTLANPEVMAILAACFEPVKVDVDADPATTKRMGVTYLPSACVIGSDDRVLARFDCPEAPTGFVAAAGRAAQDAAREAAHDTDLAPREAIATVTVAAVANPDPATRPLSAFSTAAAQASPQPVVMSPQSEPTVPAMADEMPTAPWSASPANTVAPGTAVAQRPVLNPPVAPAPPPPSPPAPPPPPAAAVLAPANPAPAIAGSKVIPQEPPAAITYGSAPPPSATAALPPTPPPPATPAEKPKPANSFWAAIQKPFSGFSKQPTRAAVTTPSTPPPSPPQVPNAGTPDPYGTMPLGLEGYCPVTLAEKGSWAEGRAQWGARHRGRTYLFAGESQQRTFLADPDRYAPALSGDDPVIAFDSGKSVPGQRRYGVTYQSRMYLFSTPETRTAFSSDPQRYTARVAMAEQRAPATGTVRR